MASSSASPSYRGWADRILPLVETKDTDLESSGTPSASPSADESSRSGPGPGPQRRGGAGTGEGSLGASTGGGSASSAQSSSLDRPGGVPASSSESTETRNESEPSIFLVSMNPTHQHQYQHEQQKKERPPASGPEIIDLTSAADPALAPSSSPDDFDSSGHAPPGFEATAAAATAAVAARSPIRMSGASDDGLRNHEDRTPVILVRVDGPASSRLEERRVGRDRRRPEDVAAAVPVDDGLGDFVDGEHPEAAAAKEHDVTATTCLDVTGLGNDDEDDVESENESKGSGEDGHEEIEIEFGGSRGGVDGDDPDLDALLAATGGDDVDSVAAEEDDPPRVEAGGNSGPEKSSDEMDDLLNDLLDDTTNAAVELEDLLGEATGRVPHVGDVDEAKASQRSRGHGVTETPAPTSGTPSTSPVVTFRSNPAAVRHVQPLASLGNASVASDSTRTAAKVSRPNLSARIPGTRRYAPPQKPKPVLTVAIPPQEEAEDASKKSTSPRPPPPRQNQRATTSAAPPQPKSKPAKKGSMVKTFIRALSGGPTAKKVPGELSPRAQSVLPILKPIDPGSRLLKETSASVGQRRLRFVPPPVAFPTIGEVMRAIHSGAFDRKSSSQSATTTTTTASPRRSSPRGSSSASSPSSYRSRSSMQSTF